MKSIKAMTRPTKFCPACNAYHSLHYIQQENGKLHLMVECPKGAKFIAFVKGLMIPTVKSRGARKREAQAKQLKLL